VAFEGAHRLAPWGCLRCIPYVTYGDVLLSEQSGYAFNVPGSAPGQAASTLGQSKTDLMSKNASCKSGTHPKKGLDWGVLGDSYGPQVTSL
jgi:hypothetical protein